MPSIFKRKLDRPALLVGVLSGLATISVIIAPGIIRSSGLILNPTASLPVGLYGPTPIPAQLKNGDMIEICPLAPSISPAMKQAVDLDWLLTDPKSPCVGHLAPFLKRVAATPGETVELSERGMTVDGVTLPRTDVKLLAKNEKTNVVHYPFGTYTVNPGKIWVTDNSSPWAYDSRYYGPIPISNVISGIRPVVTW